MENKSTANKWLIAAVIVMSIIVVAMATWIIAGAVVYKNSDSNSSLKTSQTKKDSSDSLEKLAVKAKNRWIRQRKSIKISEPKATARAFV